MVVIYWKSSWNKNRYPEKIWKRYVMAKGDYEQVIPENRYIPKWFLLLKLKRLF